MAKKLAKLAARLAALEKTVAGLLSAGRTAKAKKKKPAKKSAPKKKPAAKKKKTAPAPKPVRKPAPARKAAAPAKKAARKKSRRPPTIEKLAPSGMPEFVAPHDQI